MRVSWRPVQASPTSPVPRRRSRPVTTPAQAVRQDGDNCAAAAVTLALDAPQRWEEIQQRVQGLDGICEYLEALTGGSAYVHLYDPHNPAYREAPAAYFADVFTQKLSQGTPVCISTHPRLTQSDWVRDLRNSLGNLGYLRTALNGKVRGGILAEHAYAVIVVDGSRVLLAQANGNIGPSGSTQQHFWIELHKLLPHVAGIYFLRDK